MTVWVGVPSVRERPISIGFVGFHSSFNPIYNHISLTLRDDFPIVVAECDRGEIPDVLFFSVFDSPHLDPRYDRCIKIFTCEENIRPPWSECHFAMTCDRTSEHPLRHLRLPIYARYLRHLCDHTGATLVKKNSEPSPKPKTKFCNFVYSNPHAKERILFYRMLSEYKPVDSGGAVLNNLGYRVNNKRAFLEDYKFTIAFENSRYPGYCSEKIVEPMSVGSIPIYWGDREIGCDFNPKSFVDANEPDDCQSLEAHFSRVIDKIITVDNDPSLYDQMISEPWFENNVPNEYCRPKYIHSFMRKIFDART